MNKQINSGLSPRHLLMAAMMGCTLTSFAAKEKVVTKTPVVPTFTEWHDLQVNEVNRFNDKEYQLPFTPWRMEV